MTHFFSDSISWYASDRFPSCVAIGQTISESHAELLTRLSDFENISPLSRGIIIGRVCVIQGGSRETAQAISIMAGCTGVIERPAPGDVITA